MFVCKMADILMFKVFQVNAFVFFVMRIDALFHDDKGGCFLTL